METAGERKFVTTAQWQHRKQVGKMWTSFASVPCPAASSASWKCSINKRKKNGKQKLSLSHRLSRQQKQFDKTVLAMKLKVKEQGKRTEENMEGCTEELGDLEVFRPRIPL